MNEHYQAVLADLQQMKKDAEDGIAAIQRLISRHAPKNEDDEDGDIFDEIGTEQVDHRATKSVPQRVLELLAASPHRSFTVEEITTHLHPVKTHTVRGAINRLVNITKKIIRRGRGRYAIRGNRVGTSSADTISEPQA